MQDLEQRRKRIETAVKLIALPVIGFLVAPFVFIAVKGAIGVLAAGAVGLLAVNLMPWVAAKMANWRLKLIKDEAAKNPIETLENEYKNKIETLAAEKTALGNVYAQIENVKQKIDEHRQKFPGTESTFTPYLSKLIRTYERRKLKWKQASVNLEKYGDWLDQKRSEFEVITALDSTSKSANAGEQFMSKLMEDTATTSIQTNLNRVFSELEMADLEDPSDAAAAQTEESGRAALAVAERARIELPAPELDMPKQRSTVSVT